MRHMLGLPEELCDCVARALNTSPWGWKATVLAEGRTAGVAVTNVTSVLARTLIGRGRSAAGCIGHVTGENRCCGKTLFSMVSSSECSSESELRETFSRQFRSTSGTDLASSTIINHHQFIIITISTISSNSSSSSGSSILFIPITINRRDRFFSHFHNTQNVYPITK